MRLITLLLALVLAAPLAATTAEDKIWVRYALNKEIAKTALVDLEAGNTASAKVAITGYLVSTQIARELDRKDIEGWHFNNAAYARILLFKETLDWVTVNDGIKNMGTDNREQRKARLAAVKDMQTLASNNWQTLVLARSNLEDARKTGFDRPDFLTVVSSNEVFIEWVEDFLAKDL